MSQPSATLEILYDFETTAEAEAEERVLSRTDDAEGQTGIDRLSNMHPRPDAYQLRVVRVNSIERVPPAQGRMVSATLKISVTVESTNDTADSRMEKAFVRQAARYRDAFTNSRSSVVYGRDS